MLIINDFDTYNLKRIETRYMNNFIEVNKIY